MNEINKIKELLINNHYSLALYKNCIYTTHLQFEDLILDDNSGIKPLLNLIDTNKDYNDYYLVDKIIGRAAAFLLILLKIKHVHAIILSTEALDILNSHHIDVTYDELVPVINNRTNTGICPMEEAVKDVNEAQLALIKIKEKIKELSK